MVTEVIPSSYPLACSGDRELPAVATELLGAVQRPVRALEQHLRRLVAVPDGDARRGRATRGHRGPQPLDELARLGLVAAGHRERELLAAVAREQVGGAQAHGPGRGGLLEQPVAGEVPVLVVVGLEVVEVEDGDAQRRALAPRARELARQLLLPGAPV